MWQIQSIPTAEMYERRIGTPDQEEFLDVQNDETFQTAESLEYVFASDQSETLDCVAGSFTTAFEDQNVYQTGNETISCQTDGFTTANENMLVEQTGSETLDSVADDFDTFNEFAFVLSPDQNETLDSVADDFTTAVNP